MAVSGRYAMNGCGPVAPLPIPRTREGFVEWLRDAVTSASRALDGHAQCAGYQAMEPRLGATFHEQRKLAVYREWQAMLLGLLAEEAKRAPYEVDLKPLIKRAEAIVGSEETTEWKAHWSRFERESLDALSQAAASVTDAQQAIRKLERERDKWRNEAGLLQSDLNAALADCRLLQDGRGSRLGILSDWLSLIDRHKPAGMNKVEVIRDLAKAVGLRISDEEKDADGSDRDWQQKLATLSGKVLWRLGDRLGVSLFTGDTDSTYRERVFVMLRQYTDPMGCILRAIES